jgi:hypothetical protein
MGRTIPTATGLLHMEKAEWKRFRDQLPKSDRKLFDEMFDEAHIYNYAMMYSMPNIPVRIRLIFMSIIFHHYKELNKMMADTEGSGEKLLL